MFNNRTPPGDEDLFELLANSRRRLLIYYLFDRDGRAPLAELSREVAAHETDAPYHEIDQDETTSVYISLYQTHVPALEEEDIVEYDDAERIVSLGERSDEVVDLLRDPQTGRRWAVYYISVALLLGSVAFARTVWMVPGVVVSASTLAGAGLLLLLAVGHYRASAQRSAESSLDDLVC